MIPFRFLSRLSFVFLALTFPFGHGAQGGKWRIKNMKQVKEYIGQSAARRFVNGIVSGIKAWLAKGLAVSFLRPILLTGPAGSGKTHFAKRCIAECIGWQFVEIPAAAGIRDVANTLAKIGSVSDDGSKAYAIPSVIFCDEVHSYAKASLNIIKTMTEGSPGVVERQGNRWYRDLSNQLWVFASNESIDPAIESRCDVVPMVAYNKAERKMLIKSYLTVGEDETEIPIDESALEYLSDRSKGTARACKAIACRAVLSGKDSIGMAEAKSVASDLQLWPEGFAATEVKQLQALAKHGRPLSELSLSAIVGRIGTKGEKETREELEYMALCQYVTKSASKEWKIAESGVSYLKRLAKMQATSKEKESA